MHIHIVVLMTTDLRSVGVAPADSDMAPVGKSAVAGIESPSLGFVKEAPVPESDRPDNDGGWVIAAYEAALTVSREVSPEGVLQRIVDSAREVISARYAALALGDERGRITQVITSGLTAHEHELIGPLPDGHGLLGELMRSRNPLLIPDITADPRSVGFPPHHPPMRSLLGVPVLLGTQTLGNLYVAERRDERPFDEDDLAAIQILAVHAAAAIDRANAYHRAEEHRDQLRTILDSLPAGVMILAAPDGAIELANAAMCEMIFGPAAPTGVLPIYGRDMRTLWADGMPMSHEERLGIRALKGEVCRNQQIIIEGADKRRVPALAQSAPLPGITGSIDRSVLVLQDITRLREAEQLKDDFLSLVSHEFRTPLTAIRGGAYLLASQGDMLDQQTRQELLGDIVAESERLEQMLTNMLTLTEVMADRLEATAEPLLVGPIARATAAEFAANAPKHVIRVDLAPDLPPADGDPALLTQVLRNLIENAVKYSPDGGDIRVTGSSDGRTVTVRVEDSGIGIAANEVQHVFARFHRGGADPTVRGMGLGLYLSHHLIEAQGGHITASSSGLGQGATFSVTLPVARGWAESIEIDTISDREREQGPPCATN